MNVYDFYITPEEYERASQNGISKGTLEQRIRLMGWDKNEAITKPVIKTNRVKEWVELANKSGISRRTFEERIYTKKWSYEDAATIPIMDKKTVIKNATNKRRRFPKYILELAKKNNIPYDTFRCRVNRSKMSYEEAATMPIKNKRDAGLLAKEKGKKSLDLIFAKKGSWQVV